MTKRKRYTNKRKTAKKQTENRKTKKFLVFVLVTFCFWYYNNYTLKVTEASVESQKITEPVRLAVISDLHIHKNGISGRRVIEKIENISPDAVVVLGDLYSRSADEEERNSALSFMIQLSHEFTTYSVSGDHDTSSAFAEQLSSSGVHVLNYRDEYTEIKGQKLRFLGINNVYYSSTFNLDNAFSLESDSYNVLLAHIPNYEKFSDFGADLTLSADTHGNMVRLPFIGAVYDITSDQYFPALKNSEYYDKGLKKYDDGSMFITSGIGDSPVPVRLFNRPEVVSIDIVPCEVRK